MSVSIETNTLRFCIMAGVREKQIERERERERERGVLKVKS